MGTSRRRCNCGERNRARLDFALGPHQVRVSIHTSPLPGSKLPVYFVRCPSLYDRDGIYGAWNWRGLTSYFVALACCIPFAKLSFYTSPVANALDGIDTASTFFGPKRNAPERPG